MDSRQELHHVFELVQAQFVPIHPGDRAKPGSNDLHLHRPSGGLPES